ncbi:MAG: hypothetical protein QOH17_1236, partial [Pseudonocardiales bacterium]|nr:hypothetical protein [Pseudonocardiales bacterium]
MKVVPDPSVVHAVVVEEIAEHLQGEVARTVLISGLPGIGKSTTIGMVAERLAQAGIAVHRVEADEMSR